MYKRLDSFFFLQSINFFLFFFVFSMNLKQLLLHVTFLSSSLLLQQASCDRGSSSTTTLSTISPEPNARVASESTLVVKWKNSKTSTTKKLDTSRFSSNHHCPSNHNNHETLVLASNVNSRTESDLVQLPSLKTIQDSNNEYITKLISKQNTLVASIGPFNMINQEEKEGMAHTSAPTTTQVTQRTFVSQPSLYIWETINDSAASLPSQQPATATAEMSVGTESLTITSLQAACIAMTITACCTLTLAAIMCGSFLLNKRRERLLGDLEEGGHQDLNKQLPTSYENTQSRDSVSFLKE